MCIGSLALNHPALASLSYYTGPQGQTEVRDKGVLSFFFWAFTYFAHAHGLLDSQGYVGVFPVPP